MKGIGLQDDVDIDAMLYASTLHHYSNIEFNTKSHAPFINGTMSPSNSSSVSTLTPPSSGSILIDFDFLKSNNQDDQVFRSFLTQ